MNNNVNILDKTQCTGCGLCYNLCPKQAIKMEADVEGFLTPVIDESVCVDCGICKNNCPQMAGNIAYQEVNHAYAVICADEIREKCSSGGFFGAVGKWAIKKGGTVFGAAYSDDFRKVLHKKAETEEQLLALCKSKYLQSDTGTIYSEVKEELLRDKPVVFCGCPCQVDALKRYLKKDYPNLITIDILCHGVVSPKAYELFLEEFAGDLDVPIKSVDFRSKKLGWSCNVLVEAKDGTQRINPYHGSYFNAFLWGYSQRKACFQCKYASSERVGDFTIGDFWGIDKVLPELNDKKGTSLVLTNTEKGEKLFSEIKKYIKKAVACDYSKVLEVAKEVNWALLKPGILPKNRDVFFYRLTKGDTFSQAIRYASSPNYDVGIFGWWFEDNWTNYGSTLTYYALMEYVSSLNLSVCMITSPYHNASQASEFIRKHGYMMSPTYKFEDFAKHNEHIDTFLIGSDQLWFYNCYKSWGHSLFLDFAKDDKKKIAYATSFGHKDPKIPQEELPKVKKLLERFDAISSRETEGVKILEDTFHLNATQTLDPVFLCDTKNWEDIAQEAVRKTEGNFIFTYMLDPTNEKLSALKYLSNQLGMKVISITDKQYECKEKEEKLKKYGILQGASISELIYHLKNAKYVVTDSYHGTCFALIFRKNFVSVINAKRGTSRFDTLGSLLGVSNRFVYDAKEIIEKKELLSKPNYAEIIPVLQRHTERSRAWLDDKLLSVKQPKKVLPLTAQKENETSARQRMMKDFSILHHLGYSVGRYLKDNKITKISVYCEEKNLDIFNEFLLSLQFDNCIEVTGFYSDRTFEYRHTQSLNFGMVYFMKGMPLEGVVVYVNDTPNNIPIGNCKVLNLLSLQWKALAYANVYRPLVQYKKAHPKVQMLIVNYPVFPSQGKRDHREEYINSHKEEYNYVNLLKKIPDTFQVYAEKGYSEEEWRELFKAANSELDMMGKRHYVDYSSKLINIKNGHRVTLGQNPECDKTIYMVGGCMTYGYGCADNETTSYYLQEQCNKQGIHYAVENYGAFLNYRRKDMYQILFDLPVKENDVIVVEVWSALPEFCSQYFEYLNLRELFFRPHEFGDVFLDYSHLSSEGQQTVACKIFERLMTMEKKEEIPDISIEPMPVFGIPSEMWKENRNEEVTSELLEYVTALRIHKPRIGAIVMNCNPFTLGHRYLIETAAKECMKLYVFVVEEDKSVFKFEDRIDLVRQGTADLSNVTVMPSGKFMISSLTFKDYFNKSEMQDKQIDPTMDVEIFANYIAPALNINVRFVGEEPLDKVTKQYNDTMRKILPRYEIEFVEIPRLEQAESVISASRVRKLLDHKDFDAISKLVPETTLRFLIKNFAEK